MRKLTDNQKEFLVEYFFKHEGYAGWREIAITLLEQGTCIVAGNKRIRSGGIGNFINIRPAINAVDCSEYTFDLDLFLSSQWYKDIAGKVIANLTNDLKEQTERLTDITNLNNLVS